MLSTYISMPQKVFIRIPHLFEGVLKRAKKEEDEDVRNSRRMRTSSPIRDDLEEMKDKIASIKEISSGFKTEKMKAFLGASLGKDNMDDYWRVYVPLVPALALRECRLLRNFTKRASGFQWLLKSKRFHENGFSTSSALSLHALAEIDSIVAIGSLLLSWKALDQQNKQQLKAMLNNVEELKGLNINATAVCVERVREMQMVKGKKLALEIALLVMNEENVKDADYVELYKSLISSRLVTLNKRAIRDNKYLLH